MVFDELHHLIEGRLHFGFVLVTLELFEACTASECFLWSSQP